MDQTESERRASLKMDRMGTYLAISRQASIERQKFLAGQLEASHTIMIGAIVTVIAYFASMFASGKIDQLSYPNLNWDVLILALGIMVPSLYGLRRARRLRYYSYGNGVTGEGFWGERVRNARFEILFEWFKS
jgi:hypothetical protein